MSRAGDLETSLPRVGRMSLRFRRIVSAVCVGAMFAQMTACYTSVPVQVAGAPLQGLSTITVNDHGRLLVGAKLGSLLDRVDGKITGSDANSVQITVGAAWDVRGAQVNWGGEPVSIPREGIESITQRRVEKGSTAIVLGAIAAGLISIYIGLHHTSGSASGPDGDGGGTLISRGLPLPPQ